MNDVITTRLSSRGQVVIPEPVRKRMSLKPGVRFVVVGDADAIVLRPITAPSLAEFDSLIAQARQAAREAGLRRSDITAAVKAVRSK